MLFYKNKHIHRLIDLAGEIYNHCIALHKRYYRMTGKHLNVFMLRKQYYETQASEEIPALEKPRFPGRSGRRHQDREKLPAFLQVVKNLPSRPCISAWIQKAP
jgi:hypothetical protein